MRKMRDSGVEWIGQIPVDWKLSKIKHHFSISSGTTPKSDEPQYPHPNIGMGILFGLLQPILKQMMFL